MSRELFGVSYLAQETGSAASKLKEPKNSPHLNTAKKKEDNLSILSSYYFPSSIKPMINGPVQLMLCTEY